MNLEEKIVCYKKILESVGVELKGKNNLYTSMNGHMFSFVGKPNIIAFRLSKTDEMEFLNKYHTSHPVIQYNSKMHGYVEIPDDLLKNTEAGAKYLEKSIQFIQSLSPK